MNVPNLLTMSRLLMIPMFVIAFLFPWKTAHIFAASIFVLAAITDILDGYLARSLKKITRFGAFLDPVVDKLMVAAALILITLQFSTYYVAIPAIIIVCREILVSALREWMAEVGSRAKVAVNFIGKIKTFIQMVAIILLLFYFPGDIAGYYLKIIGISLLYVASLMTMLSMVVYLKTAWNDLKGVCED